MKSIILLTVLLLSGCTLVYQGSDGKPVPQRDADECSYQASLATTNLIGLNRMGTEAQLKEKCLALRGYHKAYRKDLP